VQEEHDGGMSDKPSYLGLLNAIAVGEAEAHAYLSAWIETSSNPDVRAVLATVAAREGEHGMSFAKRINELGYTVRPSKDTAGFAKRMSIASSNLSDLDKMEKLGTGRLDAGDHPDVFDKFFSDHSIDIATGALLGRYIAEERDSARLLANCYRALKANASGTAATPADDRLCALEAKVDAVCAAIGELQSTMTAAVSNGKPKAKAKA
jgi:hypothetical protein